MAIIRPFRGFRYNSIDIEDVGQLCSPLFDVISDSQRQVLYDNPLNSIHLSLPKHIPSANETLQNWRKNRIIKQDILPAIYPYYQTFALFGTAKTYVRKGFVCMISLTDDATGGIILHENTIENAVNDRIALLEQTGLNVAPTHGLYEDSNFELEPLMDEYIAHPVLEAVDYQGVKNQLGVIQNQKDIQKFIELLKTKPVYMADGHHRLESSVKIRQLWKEKGLLDEAGMGNYHLIYLTNLCSDDIKILPTHRVIQLPQLFDRQAFLGKMSLYFDFSEFDYRTPLYEEMHNIPHCFGLIFNDNHYKITLKSTVSLNDVIDLNIPLSAKQLDYTILHYLLLDKGLAMSIDEQPKNQHISYVKDYSKAMDIPANDLSKFAIIVNEVKMDEMLAICADNAKMPQKSTYFYPKVLCGLVFASILASDNDSPFDSCF